MAERKRHCSKKQFVYHQLGAPALIYYQKHANTTSSARGRLPTLSSTIDSTLQRINRTKFQWNYSCGTAHNEATKQFGITIEEGTNKKPDSKNATKAQTERPHLSKKKSFDDDPLFDESSDYRKKREDPSLQKKRRSMLHKKRRNQFQRQRYRNDDDFMLDDYTSFDYPYVPATRGKSLNGKPRLRYNRFLRTRQFSMHRSFVSDPAYLAPIGYETLKACHDGDKDSDIAQTMFTNKSSGKKYGNCILVFPCPCYPCRVNAKGARSWCLFHPKGPSMDRICISNLITPYGTENAGHILTEEGIGRLRSLTNFTDHALKNFPNEISLGETILELKQSGTWINEKNPECIFVVRTATFISLLRVRVEKAYYTRTKMEEDIHCYGNDICWGNYIIEEKHRVDLRSLSSFFPSYIPTSLTCHPEYGNDCTSAKFAFSTYSDRDTNAIYHGVPGSELHLSKHEITSLKTISLIDFTSSQPMCLWAAGSSFVRPALTPDIRFKKASFGLGTCLWTVDMRDNSATFQWSPSAQEMVTEGLHSIDCIATDWQQENTVFVSSKTAGKMWEIDARMPYKAVNFWSLSYSCEDQAAAFPKRGFFRVGRSLMTKPMYVNGGDMMSGTLEGPYVTVDTTPGTFGLHLLQQPLTRPRFQSDPIECIATPGLNFKKDSSIATSSVFALPEVFDDVYTCGVASFYLPCSAFMHESNCKDFAEENSNLLCSLTMTNKGDLYCHSLLESENEIADHLFDSNDLSVGTKVLRVPKASDGKTKDLIFKHWKPSGGMNLKLFLTNQYSLPQNAVCSKREDSSGSLRINKSEKELKKRLERIIPADHEPRPGSEGGVYEFIPEKSYVNISESVLKAEAPVKIPAAMIEKANREIKFYEEDCGNENQIEKSDLTSHVINTASGLWYETNSDADVKANKLSCDI